MAESPGKWQSRLMNHVASIKESNIRAFVQSNDVKPENYVSTLKKFFGRKEYLRKYDAKREATPHRKAWQKEYDAKRRQKEDNDKQRRMGSGKQPAHVGGG